jgi:hypothetical protein
MGTGDQLKRGPVDRRRRSKTAERRWCFEPMPVGIEPTFERLPDAFGHVNFAIEKAPCPSIVS